MSAETKPQEPTYKRHQASGTSIGAPSEHELDIVAPGEIENINAPDKLNLIRQQILNPEQGMPHPVGAEIVIEAIQNTLESELAGLRGDAASKHRLAHQALLDEAGLPSPLPLILKLDKSGLLRQLYNEALARIDSICDDNELDMPQKLAALGELADSMNKLQNSMMILAKEKIAAPEDPNERLFSPLD
jgi:hypothetical protein